MENAKVALIEAAADMLKTDVSKPGVDDELKSVRVVAARFLRSALNEQLPDHFRVPVLGASAFKDLPV